MTGARIAFTLDDKGFDTGVQKLGGVLRTSTIRAIGQALVETTTQRFETATDPMGQKWKALLPAYAAIKKGPGILRVKGMGGGLQSSLTFSTSGTTITIGSNKVYAAVHQFGATIKPVKGKALAFRLGASGPRGGKSSVLVLARSVTIPQRPYLGFGPKDQLAVMEQIDTAIRLVFGS